MSVEADALQHLCRQAVKTTNVCNRGYLYPQVHLESEQEFNMTQLELNSQQTWLISSDISLMSTIALNIFVGKTNMCGASRSHSPSTTSLINGKDKFMAVQALEYSGTQCLDYMSPTTSNRIKQILQREHHLKPTSTVKINIGFNGVKTIERPRGNKNIGKWAEVNNDFDSYLAELNK